MEVKSPIIESHILRKSFSSLEFLLLKRSENEKYPGVWQMVTGSISEGETGYQSALREIKEETGLVPRKFWAVPNVNLFYWPEEDQMCVVPVFAGLVNEDEEVVISGEHSEYKWVKKDEAIRLLAWPAQRKSVEIINDYFTADQNFLKFVEIQV